MERSSVASSMMASIGHDIDTSVLEIEFSGGAVCQYSGVAAEVFEAMMSSESKGKFFHANIRDRYPFTYV